MRNNSNSPLAEAKKSIVVEQKTERYVCMDCPLIFDEFMPAAEHIYAELHRVIDQVKED